MQDLVDAVHLAIDRSYRASCGEGHVFVSGEAREQRRWCVSRGKTIAEDTGRQPPMIGPIADLEADLTIELPRVDEGRALERIDEQLAGQQLERVRRSEIARAEVKRRVADLDALVLQVSILDRSLAKSTSRMYLTS